MTQHARAGTIFPVGRIGRMLRHGNYTERVGSHGPIALAAALEYLCVEVLELAGNFTEKDGMKTVKPVHLQ